MSYSRLLSDGMAVFISCASNPETTYNEYYDEIERQIKADGYEPKTTMENLIANIVLMFDCDDNYGEHDVNTGCGGYGDEFTLDECFRYVDESGGYKEFDYYV